MNTRLESLKSVPVSELEVVAICYVYETAPDEPKTIETDFLNAELFSKADFVGFDGRCDCCGSTRLAYACQIVHKPTMTGYHIGRTCAFKIEGLCDSVSAGRIENASVALLERAKIFGRRQSWVRAHPEHAAIIDWAGAGDHLIAKDIYAKLGRYGAISDRQVELLYKLKAQAAERAAKQASEPKPVGPAPQGRVEVTGEILSIKTGENEFGYFSKALIRLTAGASAGCKVWCTTPHGARKLEGVSVGRGEVVTFRATFERSATDPFFAFGSRPTLVRVESPAAAPDQPREVDPAPRDHNDADGVQTMAHCA